MTVKELIQELQKYDPNAEALVGDEELRNVTRPLIFEADAHWWDPSSGANAGFHQGRGVILA